MIRKLKYIFSSLRGIGVLILTLSFFGVSVELIEGYMLWIFIPLWIGVVGSFIIERLEKSKEKEEF